MFEDSELKIKLYVYPVIMFALGSLGLLNPGWEWFGVLTFVLGFVIATHIVVVSIIRQRERFVDSERNKLEEQRQLYETVMKMDEEARYFFGLGYVPKTVTVRVPDPESEGNSLSQIWTKLPVAPYKLKVIAQAALNGEGFTVRKWAGDGKLLSRPEWDALHESMEEAGLLTPIDPDNRTLGFMWTGLGEDVMTQIVKENL